LIYNKYQIWQRELFEQRLSQLHEIVSSYLDEHLDKKFYKKITNNSWATIPEVWDGIGGYQISNKYVRGKFVNKENGKMPCLYRIKNPDNIKLYQKDDNILLVNSLENTSQEASIYGKASSEIYAIGKTESEALDNRYLICSVDTLPERIDRERMAVTSLNYSDAVAELGLTNIEKGLEDFFEASFISQLGLLSSNSRIGINWINPIHRIKLTSFYVPTQHESIRYGPWILDYRRDEQSLYGAVLINYGSIINRSNYGKTTILTDDSLNPWEFKSYGEIQNYVIEQNRNSLVTEHRTNRGQVVCEDIPRYNLGHQIGKFSNISSISIKYGDGGVETTYSLTAFGIGDVSKQQREEQEIIKRIRNIETRTENLGVDLITKKDLATLLK
jgi:uncharacterized protein YegJ (DUF2314 family)